MTTDLLRVLYVDDEPTLLKICKIFLEKTGNISVDTLTSPLDALEQIIDTPYDAIICDFQMPAMDGITFLKKIRSLGFSTPFILFTQKEREEVVIQAIREGADSYLIRGGEPEAMFTELSHQIIQAVSKHRAEESIRDHERLQADILNFLPDATFAIETEGKVIVWNQAMEEMTGVMAQEMLGKGDYEYALPFFGIRRKMLINLISEPDETISKHYHNITWKKDIVIADTTDAKLKGQAVILTGKASPLYNQRGEVIGAIELIRDITEQRRALDELKRSEYRFRQLVEESPYSIGIGDADGYTAMVNKTFVQLFGSVPPKEYNIFNDPILQRLGIQDKVTSVLDGERISIPELYYNHHEINPEFPDNPIWMHLEGFPLYDNTGEVEYIVLIQENITERKKQEIQIREINDYLENLITHANAPIVIWGPDLVITRVNHAFELLTGRDATELVGEPVMDLLFKEFDTSIAHKEKVSQNGARWETMEIPIVHKDGSVRIVIWNSSTIFDSDRVTPLATIAQGIDVTKERQLQHEKERAIGQISENIAQLAILNDGIRNPLTIIAMYADLVGDKNITERIEDQVMRIDEMVNNLDKEWVNSEKILNYLQKHGEVRYKSLQGTSSGGNHESE